MMWSICAIFSKCAPCSRFHQSLTLCRQRWRTLFDNSIGVDLRQTIREGDGRDPCENGLRSVCWKAFLLYGPISQASWPKKHAEGRQAYVSLRDHFLRFINNPDDINSAADPLDDDDSSPWSNLRNDEIIREEIFQDVTRCMQDNFFFREPETQKKLLDILFIFSKLNPDTGYRQGMHELLAPLLWVVSQDALDDIEVQSADQDADGVELMLDVLDRSFVEHDAFNLFCAVMQTAKISYEVGDNRDASPIVTRSKRIHDELLAIFDPELALHLQVVGVLPQIYAIRWIRLLFGREFEFKDVLRIWDLLYAENLRTEIIDMTCVAMLLRIRWALVEADYSVAITALTRFSLPTKDEDSRAVVRDAMYLDKNRSIETGIGLIQRHSGRKPKAQRPENPGAVRLRAEGTPVRGSRTPQHRSSPSASPARFSTPQKQLEALFQQVSGGIQQRAEGWNVSKAVRGAVGEVRRNMNNLQTSHSRNSSIDIVSVGNETPRRDESQAVVPTKLLEDRVQDLESRNKALSKMLDRALESLRASKGSSSNDAERSEEAFNISLARIQFVSVYLADSDIPIPPEETTVTNNQNEDKTEVDTTKQENQIPEVLEATAAPEVILPEIIPPTEAVKLPLQEPGVAIQTPSLLSASPNTGEVGRPIRPSLAESSFSFMLGENRHRSSFVSSVTDPPEQRRGSELKPKPKPKQLWAEEKEAKERAKERNGSESEDDGFTMSSLRGGQQP